MQTFTTQAQAVAHLVAIGKPANLANAAVYEYFSPTEQGLLTNSEQPTTITAATLELAYNTAAEMLEVTTEGITFDGELAFDLQGNHL